MSFSLGDGDVRGVIDRLERGVTSGVCIFRRFLFCSTATVSSLIKHLTGLSRKLEVSPRSLNVSTKVSPKKKKKKTS